MKPSKIERIAVGFTRWIGSTQSIMLHTVVFAVVIYLLVEKVFSFDVLILIFNTAVSLEAIYLALFIQMTVNLQSRSIAAVEKDIDEIQEDVEEIQEDVGEISEDVDEIQEDVDELQEDVEEISEDVGEMSGDEAHEKTLADIQNDLRKLMADIEKLRENRG